MPFADRTEIEVLDREECLALLVGEGVGRVGLSMDALPVVLPVNYVVDGARIIFRTGQGTKLSAALRGAVVCFEVDDIDRRRRSGWSVVVTGTARQLTGPEEAEAADLPLEPWSSVTGDHFIAIHIDLVSGRRVGALAGASR